MKHIPWPVAALAFEVVDEGRESALLEVGFARWRDLDAPIESWSTFVCLELELLDDIDAPDLRPEGQLPSAAPPTEFTSKHGCLRLNSELVGSTVFCAAHSSDRARLTRLFQGTGTVPLFDLRSLASFQETTEQSLTVWLRTDRPVPRRAQPCAERLLRALALNLNRRPCFVALP